MSRRAVLLALVFGAPALWAAGALHEPAAHLDRLNRLEETWFPPPLHWENVEAGALWLAGTRPERHGDLHFVHLDPGASVTVRLPADAWLRLHDPVRALCPGEFEVAIGEGSGLYAVQAPERTDTRHDLLYRDPLHDERVALVTRVGGCPEVPRRSVALFVSRAGAPGDVAPYRDRVALRAPRVRVRGAEDLDYDHAYVLNAQRPVTLEVEGPRRLAVQTRMLFPSAAEDELPVRHGLGRIARNVDEYTLTWTLAEPSGGGGCAAALGLGPSWMPFDALLRAVGCHARRHVWHRLRYDTTPEYGEPVYIDGCATPTGRLEERFLDFPAGRRKYHVTASTPVLVQLRALPAADFLVPALNQPVPAPEDVRAALATGRAPVDGALLERLGGALRIAEDNTLREGSLRGAQLLMSTPVQSTHGEALRSEGRRLWARRTFYRSLLPHNNEEGTEAFAWFLPHRLVPYYEHGKRVHTGSAFLEADLMGLDSAWFTPWSRRAQAAGGRAATQEYRLPERHAPSRLRVLLDVPDKAPRSFDLWVQFDRGEPVRLTASRALAGPLDRALPAPAEAGLALLQSRMDDLAHPDFWGRLAASHPAAALLRPSMVELPLPPEARVARVWLQPGMPPCCPVRVAVQYRTSRPFELGESEYPRVVEQLPEPLRLHVFLGLLGPLGEGREPLRHWVASAGEYSAHEPAARRAAALRTAGHVTVERLRLEPDGTQRWQVLLGPFRNRRDAAARTAGITPAPRLLALPQDPEAGVRAWDDAIRGRNSDLAQLGHHWLPLLRLLQDRVERYTAGVTPERPPAAGRRLPAAQARERAQRARAQERAGDWINALETWAEVRRGGDAPARREALIGQAGALEQLGEVVLAEQLLRGSALYDADADTRRAAHRELLARYRAAGDDALIEGLLAASMLRERDQAYYHGWLLVQHLVDAGEPGFALTLGLLLPRCYQPVEPLVRAAYEARWWQLYEPLVARLPEADRAWWRGMRAALDLEYDDAHEWWERAGTRGAEWSAYLKEAGALADELRAGSRARRREALAAWTGLAARHPGPHGWRFAPERVAGHGGVQGLEVLSRDLYVQAFRATTEVPVRLRVQGPVRLRLEIRPVHRDGTPLDGWVRIEHNGVKRVLPFTHNRPIAGFEQLDLERDAIGRAEEAALELAAGLHELRVYATGGQTLLVRPHEWRPWLPLPVLPPLTAETVAAVLERGLDPGPAPATARLARLDAGTLVNPGRTRELEGCAIGGLDAIAPERLYYTAAAALPASAECTARTPEPLPPAAPLLPVPPRLNASPSQLLESRPPDDASGQLSWLIAYAWWSENRRDVAPAMQAAAESLAHGRPDLGGAGPVLARLRAASDWEVVEAVDRSAGVFAEPVTGWKPDSPYLRARRALLPPLPGDAQVLYGTDALALAFTQPEAAEAEIELTLHELPWARGAPVQLALRDEAGGTRRVRLTPEHPRHVERRSLAAGRHVFQVQAEGEYANQFVAVRARAAGQPVIPEFQRAWHVATRDEPVRLKTAAPAWLRIEQRRAGDTKVSYRRAAAGETVTLGPGDGQPETLYRLHRRVLRTADQGLSPATPVRTSAVTLTAPAAPPRLNEHCGHGCRDHVLTVRDYYPLGGQEDGTWGMDAHAVSRRSFDEDRRLTDGRDEYLEVLGDYRFHDLRRQSYVHAELLARARSDGGGPTVGARHRFDWEPRHSPLSLESFASVYGQPVERLNGTEDWEGSGELRLAAELHSSFGAYLDHTFELGVFGRWLSLAGTAPGLLPTEPDLDVYTEYKNDHRYGCTLEDRFSWTPWLDTQWFARAGLACNEDFDPSRPDVVHGTAGWRQLFGRLGVQADYRWRRFFADRDRPAGDDRGTAHGALEWDLWRSQRNRWSVRLDVWHDLDDDRSSGVLSLGLQRNNGRGYLDFRPDELSFRSLRAQRFAGEWPHNYLGEDELDH